MIFAFKKRPDTIWGKVICWWTGGPYFHVGAWFRDGTWFEADTPGGVATFLVTYLDPKHWDCFEVVLSENEEAIIREWFAGELGCGYDYLGLCLAQVFGINWRSKTKWFCSELMVEGLQQLCRFVGFTPCRISPNKFAKMVQTIGRKVI